MGVDYSAILLFGARIGYENDFLSFIERVFKFDYPCTLSDLLPYRSDYDFSYTIDGLTFKCYDQPRAGGENWYIEYISYSDSIPNLDISYTLTQEEQEWANKNNIKAKWHLIVKRW